MNMPSTKSVASSFFASAAEKASEADASQKASPAPKTDTEEAPDFMAILAMLFPANLVAPVDLTNESTNTTSAGVIADASASAASGLKANATDTGVTDSLAALVSQKPTIGSVEQEPFASIVENACDAPHAENAEDAAPNLADTGGVSQETLPNHPPGIGMEPNGNTVTATKTPIPSAGTTERASTTLSPKPAWDSAQIVAGAANKSDEIATSHFGKSLPPVDGTNEAQAVSALGVRVATEKQPLPMETRDETPSASSVSASVHRERSYDVSVARMDEPAKPAISFVDQVHSAFQDNLDHLREHGRIELHMDLHPPDLGKMRLHLSIEDNQVHVRMDVQDERAKQALDQQMQPLRVHFAEMGVSLGQLDVRRDGTGNTPQQQQNGNGQAHAPLTSQTRPEVARARSVYERDMNSDRLVDVLV